MTKHRRSGGRRRAGAGGPLTAVARRGGGRQLVVRWLGVLLVVTGLTTLASEAVSGTAGATDASAGACIQAHPPVLDRVGPTTAVVNVEYKDNCAFPAEAGVKYYRPGGGFLKESRRSTQTTHGAWKEKYFDLTDLPADKLIAMQSVVENFGTDYSSSVEFTTYFTHPTSLRLDATPIKASQGANKAAVTFKVTAGGLSGQPYGSTAVTIESSLNGRSLDPVDARFNGCTLQELQCTWSYAVENLPVKTKLVVSATFNNVTYAASFPNKKTTKLMGVTVGSGSNCAATTEKVLSASCAP